MPFFLLRLSLMVNFHPIIMFDVVMNRMSGLKNVWRNSDCSTWDWPRLLLPSIYPVKLLKVRWTKTVAGIKPAERFLYTVFSFGPFAGHKPASISGHDCTKYIVTEHLLPSHHTVSFSFFLLICLMLDFSHWKQPAFGCHPHTNNSFHQTLNNIRIFDITKIFSCWNEA